MIVLEYPSHREGGILHSFAKTKKAKIPNQLICISKDQSRIPDLGKSDYTKHQLSQLPKKNNQKSLTQSAASQWIRVSIVISLTHRETLMLTSYQINHMDEGNESWLVNSVLYIKFYSPERNFRESLVIANFSQPRFSL